MSHHTTIENEIHGEKLLLAPCAPRASPSPASDFTQGWWTEGILRTGQGLPELRPQKVRGGRAALQCRGQARRPGPTGAGRLKLSFVLTFLGPARIKLS